MNESKILLHEFLICKNFISIIGSVDGNLMRQFNYMYISFPLIAWHTFCTQFIKRIINWKMMPVFGYILHTKFLRNKCYPYTLGYDLFV